MTEDYNQLVDPFGTDRWEEFEASVIFLLTDY
jgi:hypothetical protein